MGRIGASVSGFELRLLHGQQRARAATTLCSLRWTTGQKINIARDDPTSDANFTHANACPAFASPTDSIRNITYW